MARKRGKPSPARAARMTERPTISDLNALLELRVATVGPEKPEKAAAFVGRIDDNCSPRNLMLMWAQRPDATEIHGIEGWNERAAAPSGRRPDRVLPGSG